MCGTFLPNMMAATHPPKIVIPPMEYKMRWPCRSITVMKNPDKMRAMPNPSRGKKMRTSHENGPPIIGARILRGRGAPPGTALLKD